MPAIAKIIWTLGFVIGTITHALDLFHLGWLPYDGLDEGGLSGDLQWELIRSSDTSFARSGLAMQQGSG